MATQKASKVDAVDEFLTNVRTRQAMKALAEVCGVAYGTAIHWEKLPLRYVETVADAWSMHPTDLRPDLARLFFPKDRPPEPEPTWPRHTVVVPGQRMHYARVLEEMPVAGTWTITADAKTRASIKTNVHGFASSRPGWKIHTRTVVMDNGDIAIRVLRSA